MAPSLYGVSCGIHPYDTTDYFGTFFICYGKGESYGYYEQSQKSHVGIIHNWLLLFTMKVTYY
jgi:hypothetical protein